jgi:hypothetical protein
MIGAPGSRRRRSVVPPHWFRPLNPDPHPLKPGEKVVTRFRTKDGKKKYAVTTCQEKPDDAAIDLKVDDDLEHDG